MKKRKIIAFNYAWNWNHFYTNLSLSFHNYDNQFCIWIQFLGLWFEIIFIKRGK